MTTTQAATPVARTVLGDLPVDRLGTTNAHDHLMFASPLLPGEELDDPTAADRELRRFAAAGGRTVVQWTPAGLGRGLDVLRGLSRDRGVSIIAATGRHQAGHHLDRAEEADEALAARFVRDLTATTPCGIIKVGNGFHHLDDWERQSLRAAAAASLQTGCPIVVHLELGTAGDLVMDVLRDLGIHPQQVILGHPGRNPDAGYQAELAATGAFLCFDGPSRINHHTDWCTLTSLGTLAGAVHLDQLLIGGDTTTAAARSVDSGPGMPGLLTATARRIGELLGQQALDAVLVGNPKAAFAVR